MIDISVKLNELKELEGKGVKGLKLGMIRRDLEIGITKSYSPGEIVLYKEQGNGKVVVERRTINYPEGFVEEIKINKNGPA
jgi:hypothetical protein